MTSILFPKLLAGPIVRRVDPSHAYIWLATSQKYRIQAQCFQITTRYEGNEYDKIPTVTQTQSISLGEHLHIHLVKIIPRKKFKTNKLIGYNIQFKNNNEIIDLDDLDLLNPVNPNSIVYGSLRYPTFFIAERDSEQTSNFLFGSCRKPHGEGEDTLALGDQLLDQYCRDIENRPEALFLMGDQIYADDVPDPLFLPIQKLGHALMGIKERLSTIEPRLKEEPYHTSLEKMNGRKNIIHKLAHFTSGNPYNHLIEFGEYAAMYLLAWSPALWDTCDRYELFNTFDEVLEQDQVYIRSKSENLKFLEMLQLKKRYTDQENLIENYRESTYKVRRLMANIPTYMIFDDHDITDDWNITAEWKDNVRTSSLGRHIVANGLTAYWAFQGWGNAPTHFSRQFLELLAKYFSDLQRGKLKRSYRWWIQTMWKQQPWYFVAPTTPKAIFLDTRTMRSYEQPTASQQEDAEQNVNPPQLTNERELRGLRYLLRKSGWRKGSPLLLISPTPIIGFEIIETIVTKFSIPLKLAGVSVETVFDMEAWRYNGKGLTKILQQLKRWNPSECIVLSGDVHYSFLVNSSITFNTGQTLKVKQITSSPLRNMSFHKLGPLVKLASSFNQALQNEETIHRYSDPSYWIHTVEIKEHVPEKYLWQDDLTYESVEGTSIIETENNIGYLSYATGKTEMHYIKDDLEKVDE